MDNSRLKFRAWNTEKNEWLYLPETGDIELTQYIGNSFEFSYDKDAVVILQYTGLKDKNGKEIYEGDVVKTNYYNGAPGDFKRIIGQVKYHPHAASFRVDGVKKYEGLRVDLHGNSEIVGNIYESPELLEAVNND